MQHIGVHNYGKCFLNKQPPEKAVGDTRLSEKELMDRHLASYKFLFAIENSLCTDYVTEKLGRCLKRGVVPLVASWNKELPDYGKFLPNNHSHIDVLTYKSVEMLANELSKIGNNEVLYSSFLSYRKQQPEEWPEQFRQALSGAVPDQKKSCPLCNMFAAGDFLTSEGPPSSDREEDRCEGGEVCAGHRYTSLF